MHNYTIIKDDASFHAERAHGVGGADIAILAGYTGNYTREVNGKKVPLTPDVLWLEKTGRIPGFTGNEFTKWGKLLEPVVMENFMTDHGLKEKDVLRKTSFVHPNYPFVRAHPDLIYFFDGEPVNQEIKTGSFYAKRKNDIDSGYDLDDQTSNGIPESVYCQVQWQNFAAGINTGGVAGLINTSQYGEWGPVEYNKKIIEDLLARADKFWWHVIHDKVPDPESFGDVELIYPNVGKTSVTIAGEDEEKVTRMKERKEIIEEKIKKLTAEKNDMKMAIGLLLGENSVLTGAGGDILAKQTQYKSSTLSAKKIEKENPWLYARVKKYINEFEVRRITW